jgi:ubiquinone/menaquinone biosynthesis C-methylase UbiE
MRDCRPWDIEDGDAQLMEGVADNSLDFVHSSHCLEHMKDPHAALENWLRILKPGGYLVCIIPEEDMYEMGVFPSMWNEDHKCTFAVHKTESWSSGSINVLSMLTQTKAKISIHKVELLDATYRYHLDDIDQTSTPIGECAIEFIVRKL